MKYLKIFGDFRAETEMLSDTEVGRLVRAMLDYAIDGTSPDLKGNERFIWSAEKRTIDCQRERYDNICATNKRIASSRSVQKRDEACESVTERDGALQEQEQEQEQEHKNNNPIFLSGAGEWKPGGTVGKYYDPVNGFDYEALKKERGWS